MKAAVRPSLLVLPALAVSLAAACGPRNPLDELTGEERDAFERGTSSHMVVQQALDVSDTMFDFDPTLDVTRTAAENAGLIQAHATSQLGGCGTVSLNNAAVTVAFGQSPGCTLPSGKVVTGSISLGVSKQNATLSVMVTFSSLAVDGKDLTGTLAFSTTNNTTFDLVANLSSGSTTMNAKLTVVGATGSITADGTVTSTRSAGTTTLTFTQVYWKKGDCYPSDGSVKVAKGQVTQTYSFTSSTPTTGMVDLSLGRKSVQVALPAYGSCPPTT